MSVDPLWAKYAPLQPYHYAGNEPVGRLDWDGREVVFKSSRHKQLYEEAKAYIVSRAPEAAAYFQTVEESTQDLVVLNVNYDHRNGFRELGNFEDDYWAKGSIRQAAASGDVRSVRSIDWDPSSALDLGEMGAQSPAMGLFHEILHAAGIISGKARTNKQDDETTSNPEERRVISVENVIAKIIGEAVRNCHKCQGSKVVVVKNVTDGGRRGVERPITEPKQE